MKEHRGVRNQDDALTCLSIVKMLISGKQIKTRVRAAKLLGTHSEKRVREHRRVQSWLNLKMREGKGDSQWWNVMTLVLVSFLVRGEGTVVKACFLLSESEMQTGIEFPGKVMPPIPNNLHDYRSIIYTRLPVSACCYQDILLVLNDHIPLRNSELQFL